MQNKNTSLSELYFTFLKIGSVSFGGGYAMLPLLDRELALKRQWVSEEELLDYYAIGQSTPGIIAINTATFVGYKTRGIKGGISATLGMISPSLVIIILIATFLNHFNEYPLVIKALKGVNIGVSVLLLSSVYKFTRKTVTDIPGFLLCLTAFLAVGMGHISPIPVVAFSAAAGVIIGTVKRKKK